MEEQATFEARAVLAPRRARRARLALLLPAVALVAMAWAGLSGARSDKATSVVPDPTIVAEASLTVEAPYPTKVVGLDVHRLDDVQPQTLGRDEVIAVAGWYVAKAITDCPPLAAIYRAGSLPEVRGDADTWAFCNRSGVLYASRPDVDERLSTNEPGEDRSGSAGLSVVGVTVVVGVIVPRELEEIDSNATAVVVVGRFVESGDGCRLAGGCRRELVVDHVAWTSGA